MCATVKTLYMDFGHPASSGNQWASFCRPLQFPIHGGMNIPDYEQFPQLLTMALV